MKATYRVFSILMYIAMIYSTFTGIICGVLLADSKYNGFGYPIMIITLAGFAVGLVLFFLKLKKRDFQHEMYLCDTFRAKSLITTGNLHGTQRQVQDRVC